MFIDNACVTIADVNSIKCVGLSESSQETLRLFAKCNLCVNNTSSVEIRQDSIVLIFGPIFII